MKNISKKIFLGVLMFCALGLEANVPALSIVLKQHSKQLVHPCIEPTLLQKIPALFLGGFFTYCGGVAGTGGFEAFLDTLYKKRSLFETFKNRSVLFFGIGACIGVGAYKLMNFTVAKVAKKMSFSQSDTFTANLRCCNCPFLEKVYKKAIQDEFLKAEDFYGYGKKENSLYKALDLEFFIQKQVSYLKAARTFILKYHYLYKDYSKNILKDILVILDTTIPALESLLADLRDSDLYREQSTQKKEALGALSKPLFILLALDIFSILTQPRYVYYY